MTAFNDYLNTMVDFLINNPTATKAQAVDNLQTIANVTNAEGSAWFDAIAVFYESINGISTGTFSNLRNNIGKGGAVKARELVKAISQSLQLLPEGLVISSALETKSFEDRKSSISSELVVIRDYRDALPSPPALTGKDEGVIRRALTDGAQALIAERTAIPI